MKKGSLKNTGRMLICAALALSLAPALRAAQLETEIDDAVIEVGDTTSLKVKMTGDPGDVKPLKYPSVPGLRIEYSGMERSFEYINGKSWSGVKLLFTVTALRKGSYRIPSFVFQRGGRQMMSREVALTVTGSGAGTGGGGDEGPGAGDIKSSVELSSGAAYVGQPIIMRYYLLSSGLRATVHRFNEHPETRGFAIKMIEDPAHAREGGSAGAYEKTHIVTFALIPAGAGAYRVGGGSAAVSVEAPVRRRSRDDFFGFNFPGMSRPQELSFETKPVTIMPLPAQGKPEKFQGDIGSFAMKAEYGPEKVKVYEEKKVTVTVEGSGNLITMTKPYVEKDVPGLKVISEEGESSLTLDGGRLTGSKKFVYTLVPEKAGEINAGRIMFSFFNPDSGRYETAETKEISFVATGDGGRGGGRFDNEGDEKKLDINPLYFVLIVLAVAGTVVFVVLWERRRYSLVAAAGRERDDAAEKETADERDYSADAASAADRGDSEGFLKAAEKALEQARRKFGGSVPEHAEKDMARIREEIYGYKFGRGSVAAEDMKRIIEEIRNLKQ